MANHKQNVVAKVWFRNGKQVHFDCNKFAATIPHGVYQAKKLLTKSWSEILKVQVFNNSILDADKMIFEAACLGYDQPTSITPDARPIVLKNDLDHYLQQ